MERALRYRSIDWVRWCGPMLALVAVLLAGDPADAGLNRWTSTGPPVVNSDTRGLAMHPLAPGTIYAGTAASGVFQTADGGASWTPIGTGLGSPLPFGLSMAIDPLAPATLYLGTANGGGIFKSVDAGNLWTPINAGLLGLTSTEVYAIAVDPKSAGTVYAGTSYGVFQRTAGGAIWVARNVNLSGLTAFAVTIDPRTPSTLYAGTESGGVSKSTDGAQSWERINIGLATSQVRAIAVDPQNPAIVYAATNGDGVFKSTTGGGNWTSVNANLTTPKVLSLAIDPDNPATLYAGTFTGGVFRSLDGGGSWNKLNAGLFVGIDQIFALSITRSGRCVHAATNGGVFDFEIEAGACVPPAVVASVLPSSRSAQAGAAATAFATIINPAGATARGCGIAPLTGAPTTLSFQTTNPSTNQLVGTPDTPVDIPAGGLQTYVISFAPTAPFDATEIPLNFGCVNTASAPVVVGVDTLLLSASATPVPDIVALAASPGGVVNIPGATGTGVFAVATVNVGTGGAITASADMGSAALPVAISICETNPVTSVCLALPAPTATRVIGPGETPTFAIFVTGTGVVPFDPAANRVFVRFTGGGVTRGSTSVAIRTQ